MMISPSENRAAKPGGRGSVAGMPVRLLGGGVREVSRLEVLPLGQPEVVAEVATDETEVLLKGGGAALDGRLRAQGEQMAAQMEGARRYARGSACHEWGAELQR